MRCGSTASRGVSGNGPCLRNDGICDSFPFSLPQTTFRVLTRLRAPAVSQRTRVFTGSETINRQRPSEHGDLMLTGHDGRLDRRA